MSVEPTLAIANVSRKSKSNMAATRLELVLAVADRTKIYRVKVSSRPVLSTSTVTDVDDSESPKHEKAFATVAEPCS
jgi:hypothetical protein